ncbi:hypothetical protein BH10CYA1_BH10CYA1_25900 [soil metagenome]
MAVRSLTQDNRPRKRYFSVTLQQISAVPFPLMTERIMTSTSFSLKSALFALVASVFFNGFGIAVHAQSLRSPLILGAPSAAAGQSAQEGAPPAIGSGSAPMGVTPGMQGMYNPAPPSDIPLPPMSPLERGPGGGVNSMVAPFLTPPPSTQGADPGMLPQSMNGNSPAAIEVPINSGGGYPGDQAPQTRSGRQTSRDFGLKRFGSSLTDFGGPLSQKPDLKMQPQSSQDGPRYMQGSQGGSGSSRSSNLAGAQTTQSLYGNRTLFKGSNQRARATIADH